MKALKFLAARLKEPSTAAGLIGLAALFGADIVKADVVLQAVAAAVGAAAVLLPDPK